MTHVVSLINQKGGVGKTQTTVALAEVFSVVMNKKVLVVDLDPQANASNMLIGQAKWDELRRRRRTVSYVFKAALPNRKAIADLFNMLELDVSDVNGADNIDLLPACDKLLDAQEELLSEGVRQPNRVLMKALDDVIDDYDIVLIDCPPHFGLATRNGLRLCSGYVIPVIPDLLSTDGIPQIQARVDNFKKKEKFELPLLGVLFARCRGNSPLNAEMIRREKEKGETHIFDTTIREADRLAGAGEFDPTGRTLKQKYGDQVENYESLANEILRRLRSQK